MPQSELRDDVPTLGRSLMPYVTLRWIQKSKCDTRFNKFTGGETLEKKKIKCPLELSSSKPDRVYFV